MAFAAATLLAVILSLFVARERATTPRACASTTSLKRPAYGSDSMSHDWWPPDFRCELRSHRLETIELGHRRVGVAVTTTWVALPALYAANVIVGVGWFGTRRGVAPRVVR